MKKNQIILILVSIVSVYPLSLLFINDLFLIVGIKNLLIILLFLCVLDRNEFKKGIENLKSRRVLYAIAIGIVATLFVNLFVSLAFLQSDTENNNIVKDNITHGVFLTVLIGGIIAPVGEELVFRYLLINIVRKKTNWHIGVLVSGVVFAFMHTHGNVIEVIPYLTLALILGYSYMFSKSIFAPIAIHAITNSLGLILMMYS